MNVTCAECQSVFRVDPSKVPPGGVRARCSVCGAVIRVGMEGAATPTPARASAAVPAMGSAWAANERAVMESDAEAAPEAFELPPRRSVETPLMPTPATPRTSIPFATPFSPPPQRRNPTPVFTPGVVARASRPTGETPAITDVPPIPARPSTPVVAAPPVRPSTPVAAAVPVRPPTPAPARPVTPPVPRPAAPPLAPPVAPAAAPAAAAPVARPPMIPRFTPPVPGASRAPETPGQRTTQARPPLVPPPMNPMAGGSSAPARPHVPPPVPPSTPAPAFTPRAAMPTPARAPAPPPVAKFESAPARPATPPAVAPQAAAPAAAVPPARTSSLTPAGKRGINPFLNNDPNQKGRRLARALVSDMIAYQPGKKEEGLQNGTLKAIFREEIKKSYEEYVDQIGKEFAESTTHFQDALNDLLAGGQKMF